MCFLLEIENIVYVENKRLLQKFTECKKEFVKSGVPSDETLLFHGTDSSNIDSIFTNNFKIDEKPKGRQKVEFIC